MKANEYQEKGITAAQALKAVGDALRKPTCNYCLEKVEELPDGFGCQSCINQYK